MKLRNYPEIHTLLLRFVFPSLHYNVNEQYLQRRAFNTSWRSFFFRSSMLFTPQDAIWKYFFTRLLTLHIFFCMVLFLLLNYILLQQQPYGCRLADRVAAVVMVASNIKALKFPSQQLAFMYIVHIYANHIMVMWGHDLFYLFVVGFLRYRVKKNKLLPKITLNFSSEK